MAPNPRRQVSAPIHRVRNRLLPLCFVTLAGCLGPTDLEISTAHGRGVEVMTTTPPGGVEVYQRPEWQVGDRAILRRGNRELLSFRVESIDDRSMTVRSEDGRLQRELDLDLGELRWQLGERAQPVEFDPVDKRISWPLWVGKQWTSHFVKKRPGDTLPVLARYHCDALEKVTVPTGSFDALRIWCTSRPDVEGDFEERVDVYWYAPEVGRVIRKLQGATMTELVSLETATPDDGPTGR